MAVLNCHIFLCVLLAPTIQAYSNAFLDLEELETSLFSIEISDIPVKKMQEDALDFGEDQAALQIGSKFGQQYACHYKLAPNKITEENQNSGADVNITELLEPMRGYCLVKTKDWWTYEFCYGTEITQYHVERGEKSGAIISLGKYQSDQTWLPEDLEKLKKSTLNRYHTQSYVNGSICDLTNGPRKTEVRFSCVEGEADHIGAVAELESCSYILFVYTSKICHHPYLRPPSQVKPSPIQCQPIVSQAVYDQYLADLERQSAEQAGQKDEEEDLAVSEDTDALKMLKDTMKDQFGDLFNFEDLDIQFVDADSVSERVAETLKKLKGLESASEEVESAAEEVNEEVDGGNEVIDDTELPATRDQLQSPNSEHNPKLKSQEEKLLKMIAEAMKGNTVANYKENIRHIVSAQFDDIIDEAKRELEDGGEELGSALDDINQLKKAMSDILDDKLQQLEDLEKYTKSVESEYRPEPGSGSAAVEDSLPAVDGASQQTTTAPNVKDNTRLLAGTKDAAIQKIRDRKGKTDIKVEVIRAPQQLEVEMVDVDTVEEDSILYPTAQEAKQNNKINNEQQFKTVIAVLRPMQEKGSRKEEKKHSEMESNYGKKWAEPHDEL